MTMYFPHGEKAMAVVLLFGRLNAGIVKNICSPKADDTVSPALRRWLCNDQRASAVLRQAYSQQDLMKDRIIASSLGLDDR